MLSTPIHSIALVVVDVDGTLIGSDLRLSGADIAALNRLSDNGITVAVATGRPFASARLLAEPIPDLGYLMPSNGAAVVDVARRRVFDHGAGFERQTVALLASLAEEHELSVNFYTATEWHVSHMDDRIRLEAERCGVSPDVGFDWRRPDDPIVKIMYIGAPETVRRARRRIDRLADRITTTATYYPEYLDVAPAGVSKGMACTALMTRLGIAAERVLAIGDGENDVPMLRVAGTAVALRDAHPALVDVATHLTVSQAEGAVATAVNGLVFGEPEAREKLWRRLPPANSPAP